MLYGTNPEEALANIRHRAGQAAQPGTNGDGRKLALVIEGGGMRSVCSGAGAAALAQLGLSAAFDEVYATSAAVMNASYFLSDQPLLGMSVYFENCRNGRFKNPWRFWKVIDVDYIIDRVAAVEKPLDVNRVMASPSTLYISVCDSRTGEIVNVNTRTASTPLLDVCRAAMAIPVFYNRTVPVEGRPCIDSGTVLPFTLQQAIDSGCTDILVLLTRPAQFVERRPPWHFRRAFGYLHAWENSRLRRAYSRRHKDSTRQRDLALGRLQPPPGVNIAAICPDDALSIETFITCERQTWPAAISYGRKTLSLFGEDSSHLVWADHAA
jgi:predicted patatin/cPLA2 family phospholipase